MEMPGYSVDPAMLAITHVLCKIYFKMFTSSKSH